MTIIRGMALSVSLLVAGCGGGSSHPRVDNPDSTPQPPPATSPTTPPTTSPTTPPPKDRKLTILIEGSGTVTSSPAGIDCGSDCEGTFENGAPVTLTAVPASGFHIGGWGSVCPKPAATCVVSIEIDTTLTVVFAADPGPPPDVPTGLTARAGDSQVELNWNAAARATNYKIYRGGAVIGNGLPTFTDTNVVNGTSYTYQVSAINSDGESAKSDSVVATPLFGGGRKNCEAQPSSCGYPDATNTGVPANRQLTIHEGNLKIDKPYARVYDMLIKGCVEVTEPSVTIEDSKIVCDGPYAIQVSGDARSRGQGLNIEDVDLELGDNTIGIGSRNIRIRRLRSRGGAHVGSFQENVSMEDSFISGIKQTNGVSTDAIRFDRASDVVVKHNTILAYSIVNERPAHASAAIQWSTPQRATKITLQDNLFAGGEITLICPQENIIPRPFGVKILNNRFGSQVNGHTSHCDENRDLERIIFTGNYRDQDLSPL